MLTKAPSSHRSIENLASEIMKQSEIQRVAAIAFLKKEYPFLKADTRADLPPKRAVSKLLSIINNPLSYIKEKGVVEGYIDFLNSQKLVSSPVDAHRILQIIVKFEELLRLEPRFGITELFIYGSFVNGLATKFSDIDIVEITRAYYGHEVYSKLREKLVELDLDKIEIGRKRTDDKNFIQNLGLLALDTNRTGIRVSKNKITFVVMGPKREVNEFEVSPSEISDYLQTISLATLAIPSVESK